VAVLDNFRKLELARSGRHQVVRSWLRQDKGHHEEWEAIASNIHSGQELLIPFDEIVCVTKCTISIMKALYDGKPIQLIMSQSEHR
jgi:hypothetical protein